MKYGQLIIRKIVKIVATRCQISRLKMHQNRFWRSPRFPSWNKGNLLLREEEGAGRGRQGEWRERGECRGRKGRGPPCVSVNFFRIVCV